MRLHRSAVVLLLIAATSAIVVACGDTKSSATSPTLDPNGIAYSFVVMGCNRLAATETLGVASSANVPGTESHILRHRRAEPEAELLLHGRRPRPRLHERQHESRQGTAGLDRAVQGIAARHIGRGTRDHPGNHETDNLAKVAYAPGERTWLRDMAAYITRGGNGPTAGGADALQTDQSKLTYSFDFKDAHFVTLNTDPVGDDWHVPVYWVAEDIAAARARGQKHVFAIGHKPAYPYPTVPTDGLVFDPVSRNASWNVLQSNQVEAMFSAHNHVGYHSQPTGHTWMIIAGNGGTPIDATVDPTIAGTGTWFGFTLVTVTNSGRVFSKSYGRDAPATNYAGAPTDATTMRDSTEITWK